MHEKLSGAKAERSIVFALPSVYFSAVLPRAWDYKRWKATGRKGWRSSRRTYSWPRHWLWSGAKFTVSWRHWVHDGFDTKRKWACGLHLIPCVLPSPASKFVFGLEKRSTSLLACSCFGVLLSYVLNRSVYLSSNLLNSMLFFVVVSLHVRLGVAKSLSTVTNVNISL